MKSHFVIVLVFLFSINNFVKSLSYIANSVEETEKPHIEGDNIVNATRGKAAVLKCIVHNVKSYKIAWYFNGILLTLNNLRIKEDKRFSVENPQVNEWKLIIDPVDSSNEGQYSCQLTNRMRKTIFLKVGVAPTFIENNGSHQILINTMEKQNVTLSCEADGNPTPTIYWYRHNNLISTGPQLIIRDINRNSPSEYECVARNNIDPDPSRHFKINVNFKPTLNLMYYLKEQNRKLSGNNNVQKPLAQEDPSIISEGDLQLVCEIVGYPINSITWFKDGVKMRDESSSHGANDRYMAHRSHSNLANMVDLNANNADFSSNSTPVELKKRKKHTTIHTSQLNSHKFVSKLKIKNFDKTDNGVYKCSVNGFEGEYSKSIPIDEIKHQTQNEVEYTFNLPDKNQHKSNGGQNKFEKAIKHSTTKNKNHEVEKIVESGYLFNDRGRGARSNLTKSETNEYDYEESNNASVGLNCPTNLIETLAISAVFVYLFGGRN